HLTRKQGQPLVLANSPGTFEECCRVLEGEERVAGPTISVCKSNLVRSAMPGIEDQVGTIHGVLVISVRRSNEVRRASDVFAFVEFLRSEDRGVVLHARAPGTRVPGEEILIIGRIGPPTGSLRRRGFQRHQWSGQEAEVSISADKYAIMIDDP